MLYWGMFTAGFIVGGILASFVLSQKTEKSVEKRNSLSNAGLAGNAGTSAEDIFSKLTKVNFYSKSSE